MDTLNSSKKRGNNPGFTLLEVLVAVAITGMALAVLLGSVNKNLTLTSESRNLTIASTLAQKKMTEIESQGVPEEGAEEEGEFEDFPDFKWRFVVEPLEILELAEGIEMKRLKLTILWEEGRKNLDVEMAISRLK